VGAARAYHSNLLFQNYLVMLCPKYLSEFFKNQDCFRKWPIQGRIFSYISGDGIVFLEGEAHRRERHLISQVFSYALLDRAAPRINALIELGIQAQKHCSDYFPVLEFMTRISSSVVLQLFLGTPSMDHIRVEGEPLSQAINRQFTMIGSVLYSPSFLLLGRIPEKVRALRDRINAELRGLIRQRVASYRDGSNRASDIVVLLLDSRRIEDEEALVGSVLDEFKNFYIAGSDTTSTLAAFCIYYLSEHPEVRARVEEEVLGLDLAEVRAGTGKELPWLNGFIKEVQRMAGPLNFLMVREATQDVVLDDLFVPRGTLLNAYFEYNHFSEQHFQRPYELRPERWFNGETDQLDLYAFVPFSAGPRNCIGQHLALLEVRLVLAHFLRAYTFEVRQPFEPLGDPRNIFDYFKAPFEIRVRPRAR
jgi:cytochrome P450